MQLKSEIMICLLFFSFMVYLSSGLIHGIKFIAKIFFLTMPTIAFIFTPLKSTYTKITEINI